MKQLFQLELDQMASSERPVIVRAMPNTPCLIGSGAVGFFVNAYSERDHYAVSCALKRSAPQYITERPQKLFIPLHLCENE